LHLKNNLTQRTPGPVAIATHAAIVDPALFVVSRYFTLGQYIMFYSTLSLIFRHSPQLGGSRVFLGLLEAVLLRQFVKKVLLWERL